ncbi:MAG TPA: serine hydrolase domain-containing protein [Acidimicrobiales bacterium]|nr:serine hydrolase domain-containing protein [Acidimicrobiales bacterium]
MTRTQAPALARPDGAPDAAHRIVEDFVRRRSIPGLSIVIVDRQGPLFTAGYGHRDLATGDPATPETTYLWFSLTKIVTASAALRLADDGALDLDAPITDFLPRAGRRDSTAKVRHLLNHTAGFGNPLPIRWVRPAHAPAVPSEDLLARLLGKHRGSRHEVGGAARYSNLGYLVLGAVIEAAARQSFPDYVRDTILRPLGLTGTDFTHVDPRLAATGYVKAPRAVSPLLHAVLPDGIVGPRVGGFQALNPFYVEGASYGGLVGSALDAGRFATAHLDDGAANGARILRSDTTRRMRQIDTPGRKIDVGQGWFRRAEHRTSTPSHVEHLGAGGGFFNVMRLYPSLGLGFVVMANTTHPYAHHELFNDLLRLPWSSAASDERPPGVSAPQPGRHSEARRA